jgi:hypothetical protein
MISRASNYLMELYLIIRVVNLLTEYAAFIWLKHKEPDRPRPFEAPFGIVGAVLMVIPTLIISTIAIVYAGTQEQWKMLSPLFSLISFVRCLINSFRPSISDHWIGRYPIRWFFLFI